MRRLFVLVLALGVLAAGAATARAATVQNINPYKCPASSGGTWTGNPWTVSAAESGGLPVQLSFGWAALKTQQLNKFISVESGSLTLTDPSGNVVYQDSWGFDATGWSAYTAIQVTPNGTTFKSGWATNRHEQFGVLSNPNPGTDAVYNLTMNWTLGTASVNDGFGSYTGPIVQVTNCPILVHNYNS
jgi:hypothetical protein